MAVTETLRANERNRRTSRYLVIALAVAGVATLATVAWYPYPDLQQGYAAIGGVLMVTLAAGAWWLLRREWTRDHPRLAAYQAVNVIAVIFLVVIAPSCIGSLLSAGP